MSTTATITINGGAQYEAPINLLDLEVKPLEDQGMDRALAVAVVSRGLKLYAHGRADLGYGVYAEVTGQLGG